MLPRLIRSSTVGKVSPPLRAFCRYNATLLFVKQPARHFSARYVGKLSRPQHICTQLEKPFISRLQSRPFADDRSSGAKSAPDASSKDTLNSPGNTHGTNGAKRPASDVQGSPLETGSSPQQHHSRLRQDSETDLDDKPLDSPSPSGPLPDLRQGIPSSFEPKTSDASSSFKTKDAEDPNLNLTDAPERTRRREEGPREEYVSSIDRQRQRMARYMGFGGLAIGVLAFVWLGRDWESDEEAKAHPNAPKGWDPLAWWSRFKERLGGTFSHYTEPAFPKLLPDQPADQRMPYTLVLSLEDLLVTSTWNRTDGYKVAKRPGVDYFLRYLCQYYELVVFTTVQTANADLVLRQLDPFSFCYPLFRESTKYVNGEHVKDLTYLNRDLSKTIIIDTRNEHVSLQPENAIVLPKWNGSLEDPHTVDLVALIPFLEYIAAMELDDVRKVIDSYKDKDIPAEFARREAIAREEMGRRIAGKSGRTKSGPGILGGLGNSLGFKPTPTMVIPGEQSPYEALAEGKMLVDQIRERGKRQYQEMEKQIRENGETWLKQRAEEEKKAAEEATRNMTQGVAGWFGGKSA